MSLTASALVYEGLPISSGGAHGLGRMQSSVALSAWSTFLTERTWEASAHAAFSHLSDFDDPAAPMLTAVLERFEPGPDSPRIVPVPMNRVEEAVRLVDELYTRRRPQRVEPLLLQLTAEFVVSTPFGSGAWPGQDPAAFGDAESSWGRRLGTCSARLNIAGSRSMGLDLCFPGATDEQLRVLVPWLEEVLPFRLSSKQWKRFALAKNGRTYVGRRVDVRSLLLQS